MKVLAVAVALLTPPPAVAEVAVMEIVAGADRLAFTADQISAERTIGRDVPEVLVALQADMARQMAAMTARHIGEELVIRVCGEEVMRPVLMEPIVRGRLMISVASDAEAQRVAVLLQTPECPQ